MDCAKSLELLSEYRDGILNEREQILVSNHLAACEPCKGIFQDIDSIVVAAVILRNEDGITFPDERVLWQRMRLGRSVH